ncbi:extracellular solute-binding protein [Cohnella sp.]|uniref:extracellular solute-binding protein n=1 Tax=Cohnella sp. TaxID=1883426 RepID=UPI003563EA73
MKRMKSISFIITITTILAILLSACGSNDSKNSSSNASSEPSASSPSADASSGASPNANLTGTLKVQFIGDFSVEDKTDPKTGVASKGIHVIKEEFEKQYPGTKVEFITMGWDDYNEKTQTMLQSNAADVYQVPGIAKFAEQDLLEPLQPYIDRDQFDLDQYLTGQIDGWKAMGPNDQKTEIYGLPFIGDARLIVYDKQLFDEWGVDYLSESPTPEEVMDKAQKMTGKNPKTGEQNYGITYKAGDAADSVMNINEFKGSQWGTGFLWKDMKVDFNSPTMVDSLNWLVEATKYAPTGVLAGQGSENFLTAKNNIAIALRMPPGFINDIAVSGTQDRFQAALLFKNPAQGMGGMFAGSPFAIGKTSKNKDLAWEWLKFSGSDFFQKYMWESQRNQSMPVIKSAANWDEVKAIPQMSVILQQMSQLWTPRYPYRSGQPRYILSENVEKALLNQVTAKEALDKAQKDSTEWILSQ